MSGAATRCASCGVTSRPRPSTTPIRSRSRGASSPRARAGSTSSTSTPPAPASRRTSRPSLRSPARSRARCRRVGECAASPPPPRCSTPASRASWSEPRRSNTRSSSTSSARPIRTALRSGSTRAARRSRCGAGSRAAGPTSWSSGRRFAASGVAALIVTEIGRDGTLEGPDLRPAAPPCSTALEIPVVASGGVGTLDDLRALDGLEAGGRRLVGAIVGRALYESRFTVTEGLAALRPVSDGARGRVRSGDRDTASPVGVPRGSRGLRWMQMA